MRSTGFISGTIIALLLFGIPVSQANAQANPGAFTEYRELQGFCKGGCRSRFEEDSLGNIWIYNQNGLVRFDGSKIDRPDLKEILTSTEIQAIQRDGAGGLWVATAKELCRFDGKEWKKFTEEDGLGYEKIWTSALDDKGVVWFNTKESEHGIYTYQNGRFSKFTPLGIEDTDNLRFFGCDNQAVLWFLAHGSDIYRLEGDRLNLVAKNAVPRNFLGGRMPFINYGARVTRTNALLLTLSGKMYRVEKDGMKQIQGIEVGGWFSDQTITFLFEDSRGTIWVGHGDWKALINRASGVYRVEGDKVEHLEAVSKSWLLKDIFEDSQGKLWFSSWQGPSARLQQLDGKAWKTVYEGHMGDDVENFFEDSRHNFWFGLSPKGKFIVGRPE